MNSITIYSFTAVSLSLAGLYIFRRHFGRQTCHCLGKLAGKTVLITGGNSGIGKATAKILAVKGARIILACRDVLKAEEVAKVLRKECGNKQIEVMHLDLASFKSIKEFAVKYITEVKQLDVLINNAAVFYTPFAITEDGFERVFQTNYLGHFLLTYLLMELLEKCSPSRIVNLSSEAHRFRDVLPWQEISSPNKDTYSKMIAYGYSKLAINLFTLELHNNGKGKEVYAVAVNPGNVDTNIYRDFPLFSNCIMKILMWPLKRIFYMRDYQGAQTVVHAALAKDITSMSGKYLSDCGVGNPSPASKDQIAARMLWRKTVQLLGL